MFDDARLPMVLPDLLEPGLKLVFCGTAASRKSAEAGAYYAKPGNRFWPTLHLVGLTPRRLRPDEFPLLLEFRIGLTDLCKTAYGTDAELPEGAFDVPSFAAKIALLQPAMVAFTSKNAGRALLGHQPDYGLQRERIGKTRLFVLPSPSGLATRFFDPGVWQMLADTVAGGVGSSVANGVANGVANSGAAECD